MANLPQEHCWQFYVSDGVDHSADSGAAYFERQAQHLANTLGCRLVTSKNVSMERSGNKWIISGT